MDWSTTLNSIMIALVSVVGSALLGLASWAISKLVTWLKSKTANIQNETVREVVESMIDGIAGAVEDAVKSVASGLTSIADWTEEDTSSAVETLKKNLQESDIEYIVDNEINEETLKTEGEEKAVEEYLTELVKAEIYNLNNPTEEE